MYWRYSLETHNRNVLASFKQDNGANELEMNIIDKDICHGGYFA
jgi:hypothetical protein